MAGSSRTTRALGVVTLEQLLLFVTGALDRVGIPYMVVGSLASTVHGEPRATQDVDIVIDPDRAQLDELLAGLDRSVFYVGSAQAALDRRDMFNVVDTTSGWKVDFIIRKDREFSIVELDRRTEVEVLGIRLFVASPEDTILAKLEWSAASGSDRQLADAAAVVLVSGELLDWDHLHRWADVLGVAERLSQLVDDDVQT